MRLGRVFRMTPRMLRATIRRVRHFRLDMVGNKTQIDMARPIGLPGEQSVPGAPREAMIGVAQQCQVAAELT